MCSVKKEDEIETNEAEEGHGEGDRWTDSILIKKYPLKNENDALLYK